MKAENLDPADRGASCLLHECGNATFADTILIVFDPLTREAANHVFSVAQRYAYRVSQIETSLAGMHGEEPDVEVQQRMRDATLILGMRSKSMAHTQARVQAARGGARYLSLPDYSLELLKSESLTADFRNISNRVKRLSDLFTRGESVRIRSPLGTDIRLDIRGRTGNACPGYVSAAGELGSPPDIEANVSPIETQSHGIAVIDGSIPYPGLGLLLQPVVLTVRDGKISEIRSRDAKIIRALEELFERADPSKTKILAEFGVGLNPKAVLEGNMLTDEGAEGTAHFGFGANSTVGGTNSVPFHLDFVFRNPLIEIDGVAV